jgi:hypothetical protein
VLGGRPPAEATVPFTAEMRQAVVAVPDAFFFFFFCDTQSAYQSLIKKIGTELLFYYKRSKNEDYLEWGKLHLCRNGTRLFFFFTNGDNKYDTHSRICVLYLKF